MKAMSTIYRTQIIENALRLRYQDLIDDIIEFRDDICEAVKKEHSPALLNVVAKIALLTQEMDEIHRMLGEKSNWIAE